jgi:DNA-binding winged helix-turn-helix (wHTH) protein
MAAHAERASPLRFGPFEVDSLAGELRKAGIRIRLSGQPFQILLILLEQPSEVVTREQLREQIWKEDIFVDFEGGLNAAVNKLRRALNDSAENPRYIETIPTRGYRFIGHLEDSGSGVHPVAAATAQESERPHRPAVVLGRRRAYRTDDRIVPGVADLWSGDASALLEVVAPHQRCRILGLSGVVARWRTGGLLVQSRR